jgi:hypothetical protein
MRKSLLAAALWLASVDVFGATLVIPLAGRTPGANGTMWVTDLSLTNDGFSPATVELVFHGGAGSRSRMVSLLPYESQLLEDVAGPEPWFGQLEIRSAAKIRASAHIFNESASGTFGSVHDGVDLLVLPSSGTLAGLVSNGRFRSNVAFANPGEEPATYEYSLHDESGNLFNENGAATHLITVPPHTTQQVPIRGAGVHLLTWTGDAPGYVVGSVIDNLSGDPATTPSVVRGTTRLFFPVIGKTAGTFATRWSTSMVIASAADTAGDATFLYRDGTRTYRKTTALGARATISAEDALDFVGAPAGQGSLEVLASVPLTGWVRVFNTLEDGATFGSSILPQESFVRSDRVYVHNVRRDASYRLNIAISNDTAIATSGVVRLSPGAFPVFGVPSVLEEKPFSLPAGGTIQIPLTADVRAGTVEVATENGVGVTVLASNVDNRTGDTVVREAEQANERQDDGHEIVMSAPAATVDGSVVVSVGSLTDVENVFWSLGEDNFGTFTWGTLELDAPGVYEVTAEITLANGTLLHDRETIHISDTTPAGPIGFTWSPADPRPGQEVTFAAACVTCLIVDPHAYVWKFPGGVRKTGNAVTFTFPVAGSFEVVLELEGAYAFETVTVGADSSREATSIDFTWSPQAPRVLQTATFVAALDGFLPAGSWVLWRMPGGINLDGRTEIWAFSTPGTFEVEAVIMNGPVAGPSRKKTITVAPVP